MQLRSTQVLPESTAAWPAGSREKPETRSRASTSRRTAVNNIATRPSSLAMRSRKAGSPLSAWTSETISPTPPLFPALLRGFR